MKTQKSLKQVFLFLLSFVTIALISSCGDGKCLPSSTNENFNFSISSPSEYPAGVAVTVPAVVKNTSNHIYNHVSYRIANNTTGSAIFITEQSLANCETLESGQNCSLAIEVPSTSKPGAFSIIATSSGDQFGLTEPSSVISSTIATDVQVSIGLTELPLNDGVGANGIAEYYNNVVSLPNNNSGTTIVTFVVTSANAGAFNTIELLDGSGNQLEYQVLTGNSGSGLTTLSQGAIVSLAVQVPSGATQLSFYPTLKLNGNTIANGSTTSPTTITVLRPTSSLQGSLSVVPSNFVLNESNPTQIVTVWNNGNGTVSNLLANITSPMIIDTSASTCGSTLAAGAICTYSVTFDATHSDKAGTGVFTVNYNTGVTTSSDTSTFTYQGKLVVANLTISSGTNPNFDFTSTTANPGGSSLVTITNSGVVALESFSYTLPSYFSESTAMVPNACSANLTLQPNQSCNITLVYSNSTVTPATTSTVTVGYKYINLIDRATIMSGSSSVGITYQTIQSQAILVASPSPVSFGNILNNNYQYNSQVITLTNIGDAATANTTIISLATLDSIYSIESNTCTQILNAAASCTLTINAGPIESNVSAGTANNTLNISYQPYPSAATNTTTAALTTQVVTAQTAVINVTNTESSGFVGGNGTLGTPFMLQRGVNGSVTYMITNTGAVPAESFNLTYSPSALSPWVATGSCTTMQTLAANGGSCTITFLSMVTNLGVNREEGVGNNNLPVNIITMNWIDQDSPTGQSQAFANSSVYVNLFSQPIIQGMVADLSIAQGMSTSIIFRLVGGYNVPNQVLTIAPLDSSITYNPSNGQCTVSSTNSTCSITISSGINTPIGIYTIQVSNGGSVPLSSSSYSLTINPVAAPYAFGNPTPIVLSIDGTHAFITTGNLDVNSVT